MITGKTESGFEYEVDKDVMNDYELLELISEAEDTKYAIVKVVDRVLGTDQKKRLLEHLRNEKGKVPLDLMDKEIADIFKGVQEGKNS